MNRRGSITLILMLTMTVILSTCIYMVYLATIQTYIVNNSQMSIQSRIIADGDINRILYDECNFEEILLPEIYKIIRNKVPPFITKDSNKDGIPDGKNINIHNGKSVKSVNIRLEASKEILNKNYNSNENFSDDTSMILRFQTEFEGIDNIIEVRGKVINEIFEIKEPFINELNMTENNLSGKFKNLMDNFENEIFDYIPIGNSPIVKINLDKNALIDEKSIIDDYGNIIETYNYTSNYVLLNIKSGDNRPTIQIKNQNISKLKIKGNIYCEGDLIISSPFELDGNLILNGGSLIIDTSTKPIIKGKIFYRGDGDLEIDKIKVLSEKRLIYRYGSYLPGFLDIEINVIKS